MDVICREWVGGSDERIEPLMKACHRIDVRENIIAFRLCQKEFSKPVNPTACCLILMCLVESEPHAVRVLTIFANVPEIGWFESLHD